MCISSVDELIFYCLRGRHQSFAFCKPYTRLLGSFHLTTLALATATTYRPSTTSVYTFYTTGPATLTFPPVFAVSSLTVWDYSSVLDASPTSPIESVGSCLAFQRFMYHVPPIRIAHMVNSNATAACEGGSR
jgi:hypothetical protein